MKYFQTKLPNSEVLPIRSKTNRRLKCSQIVSFISIILIALYSFAVLLAPKHESFIAFSLSKIALQILIIYFSMPGRERMLQTTLNWFFISKFHKMGCQSTEGLEFYWTWRPHHPFTIAKKRSAALLCSAQTNFMFTGGSSIFCWSFLQCAAFTHEEVSQ